MRRQYLLRAWRIQTTFLITGILFPIATTMLVKNGLSQLELSWDEMTDMAIDADALFYRGLGIVERLSSSHAELKEFAQQQNISASNVQNSINDEYPWCPNLSGGLNSAASIADEQLVAQFNSVMSEVTTQLDYIISYLPENVPMDPSGLISATRATEHVKSAIEWTKSHDWLLKFLLMMVNVLSMFLILASYIVYQISPIVHIPSRFYLAWVIVPFWSVLCILVVVATAMMGIATLVNADFCAGGESPGSPQGALEDAILSNRLGTLDRDKGDGILIYESFMYYANVSCRSWICCFNGASSLHQD